MTTRRLAAAVFILFLGASGYYYRISRDRPDVTASPPVQMEPVEFREILTLEAAPAPAGGHGPNWRDIPLHNGIGKIRIAGRTRTLGLRVGGENDFVLHIDRDEDGDPFNDIGVAKPVTSSEYIKGGVDNRGAVWLMQDLGGQGVFYQICALQTDRHPFPERLDFIHGFIWRSPFRMNGRWKVVIIADVDLDGMPSQADGWLIRDRDNGSPINRRQLPLLHDQIAYEGNLCRLSLRADGSVWFHMRPAGRMGAGE